jgi:hypothetical protein
LSASSSSSSSPWSFGPSFRAGGQEGESKRFLRDLGTQELGGE